MKLSGFIKVKYFLILSLLLTLLGCGGSKTVLMVMPEKDFYDPEYTIPREMLEKKGYSVRVITPSGSPAIGIEGLQVTPDSGLDGIEAGNFKALLLVGGYGAESFLGDEPLKQLVRDFHKRKKLIGAQCITPSLVAEAGLLNDTEATCWPTFAGLLESKGALFSGRVTDYTDGILTAQAGTPQNIRVFGSDFISLMENPGFVISSLKNKKEFDPPRFTINNDGTEFTLVIKDRTRTGKIYIPSGYDEKRKYSLVFGLHGMGSNGASFAALGFNAAAEDMDFILCYPDGVGAAWNDVTDRQMFVILMDEFIRRYSIDPERIYITGHSAGAIKAYELAQALPDRIAAIAPVAGLVSSGAIADICKPVSVLHLHALDDSVVPYGGSAQMYLRSAEESDEFWRGINSAAGNSEVFHDADGIKGTIWKGPIADTANLVYASGNHGWLPRSADFITGFFYTHPARPVMVTLSEIPAASPPGKQVTLAAVADKPESVSMIRFYADGVPVGETSAVPYRFNWTNPTAGIHRITARAVLKNGSSVVAVTPAYVIIADPDISAIATVSVSSEESSALAGKFAHDGDRYTRWGSAFSDPQYLTIDLKGQHEITGVSLFWEAAHASSFGITVSTDGNSWKEVFTTDNGKGNAEYIPLDRVRGRYLRIDGKKRNTVWGYSLWELVVHGK